MPYNSLSDEKKKELWSDGMHPTEAGYDLMGTAFAKRLSELITEAESKEGEQLVKAELKARNIKGPEEVSSRVLRSFNVNR